MEWHVCRHPDWTPSPPRNPSTFSSLVLSPLSSVTISNLLLSPEASHLFPSLLPLRRYLTSPLENRSSQMEVFSAFCHQTYKPSYFVFLFSFLPPFLMVGDPF